jgi:hypothetical protein
MPFNLTAFAPAERSYCWCISLLPGESLAHIVSLVSKDTKLANLFVLRLDIRSQVKQGVPRMRYP